MTKRQFFYPEPARHHNPHVLEARWLGPSTPVNLRRNRQSVRRKIIRRWQRAADASYQQKKRDWVKAEWRALAK